MLSSPYERISLVLDQGYFGPVLFQEERIKMKEQQDKVQEYLQLNKESPKENQITIEQLNALASDAALKDLTIATMLWNAIDEIKGEKEVALEPEGGRTAAVTLVNQKKPRTLEEKLAKNLERAKDHKSQQSSLGFLSPPINTVEATIEPCSFEFSFASCGIASTQGLRKTMEDAHLAQEFMLEIAEVSYPINLFGVFDGHGGAQASSYAAENFPAKLLEAFKKQTFSSLSTEGVYQALINSCASLNAEIKALPTTSGSTAIIALLLQGNIWVINIGDSRAILDNGMQLSNDASVSNPHYRNKYLKKTQPPKTLPDVINFFDQSPSARKFAGPNNSAASSASKGYFSFGGSTLAVYRSLGDKKFINICEKPKITCISIDESFDHLILACDGLFDVASTEEVAFKLKSLKEQTAEEIAVDLTAHALGQGSTDNVTCLVVKLKK